MMPKIRIDSSLLITFVKLILLIIILLLFSFHIISYCCLACKVCLIGLCSVLTLTFNTNEIPAEVNAISLAQYPYLPLVNGLSDSEIERVFKFKFDAMKNEGKME